MNWILAFWISLGILVLSCTAAGIMSHKKYRLGGTVSPFYVVFGVDSMCIGREIKMAIHLARVEYILVVMICKTAIGGIDKTYIGRAIAAYVIYGVVV